MTDQDVSHPDLPRNLLSRILLVLLWFILIYFAVAVVIGGIVGGIAGASKPLPHERGARGYSGPDLQPSATTSTQVGFLPTPNSATGDSRPLVASIVNV